MTKLRDRLIRLAYKGGPAMMRLALFGGIADSGEAAATEARRRPDLRYLIFFTARSGSSHLSSLIGALPQVAKPGESFNPYLMRGPATKLGSRDIETYTNRLIRQPRFAFGFGAKVIAPHLQVLFGAPERLFELVEPTHLIWLIREDIVAQGVSMAKMRQTGLAHATSGAEAVRRSEAGLRYNAGAIKHWIGRTARDERRTEALMARSGLVPLRLSYERMLAMGDAAVLAQVMAHLGRAAPEAAAPSPHHKISGQTSAAAAARFAAEQAPFLARVAARRALTLTRLAET